MTIGTALIAFGLFGVSACTLETSTDERLKGVVVGAVDDGDDPCTILGHAAECDVCAEEGWYDDGVCDRFCDRDDPDCEGEEACSEEECGVMPPGCDPPMCADGSYADCNSQCVRNEEGRCHWTFEYGECSDSTCGGADGLPCLDDEYCDYEHDSCGLLGEIGVCQPRPVAWDAVYAPVCGCDGETYGNEGQAYAAGVDIIRSGACEERYDECTPEECGVMPPGCAPPECADGSMASCTPMCAPDDDGRCGWSFEYGECPESTCGGPDGIPCGDDEFCDYEHDSCGLDGERGLCQPRPPAWDAVYEPACGCDGETYSNEGGAYEAGFDILHYGDCEE